MLKATGAVYEGRDCGRRGLVERVAKISRSMTLPKLAGVELTEDMAGTAQTRLFSGTAGATAILLAPKGYFWHPRDGLSVRGYFKRPRKVQATKQPAMPEAL